MDEPGGPNRRVGNKGRDVPGGPAGETPDLGALTDRVPVSRALAGQAAEISRLFSGLPESEFFAAQGDHWSPAEHLRHLVKSVRPVARAMRMPRLLLGVLFGRNRRSSRSADEIVRLYREQLSAGAGAGRFAPSSKRPEIQPAAWRRGILEGWRAASSQLTAAVEGWSEPGLDRYLLPHPLLGKLTIREMLFFTLYHNAHHGRRVVERRAPNRRESTG